MPTQVVDINLSTSIAAAPQPTFNDVVIVGHNTSGNKPADVDFNSVEQYSSASDVSSDFGSNHPVLTASEALAEMGVSQWYTVLAETQTVTDELLGGDTSVENTGTISNTPLLGDESVVTISVDGTDLTTVPKTSSPPDANVSPGNDEAFVNFDTGEVVTGTDTGGASAGIEADYDYIDWGPAETTMQQYGIDLYTIADTHFGRDGIGDLDELVGFASSNDGAVVAASVNGNDYSADEDAMDIAHEVGGYVSSGSVLHVAHKSGDDVASYILGQLAVNDPWFDPFWDADGYPFSTDYYDRALIGDPGTNGTFEGGDAANGAGPTNVVINKGGVDLLSNSVTTAGASSNYQYLDVKRTETYVATEVEQALENLRLAKDQIPYTKIGRNEILGAIRGRLSDDVGQRGEPLSSINVSAPTIENISDADKANRVFPNITVQGTLAGNVHTFGVELNIRV